MLNSTKKIAVFGIMVLALVLLSTMICFANDSSEEILHGDIVDDNSINLKDVAALRDKLSKDGKTLEIYSPYDVDGNSLVNMKDLVLLRRYLADYNFDTNTPSEDYAIGAKKIVYNYTSGDGASTLHHENAQISDYEDICEYIENDLGCKIYCSTNIGNLVSTTYTADDAVFTVSFNVENNELYFTIANGGASALPVADENYTVKNETTVTQNYSANINGMCYIIKLADGSFIVVDGGYASEYNTDTEKYSDDAKNVYNTLVELNGGSNDIYIRAWLITHSHTDHYRVFKYFANYYADAVTLDTVLCSPVSKGVAEYDQYLTVTVKDDAEKIGADIAYVRTGMSFQFADVTLEILITPEQIYKVGDPGDFNQTSVVSRVKNADGSMIFLGDCGKEACDWLVPTYGDALKSDMVQVAHHGCETATTDLYDKIAAPVAFWPCSVALMTSNRGPAKQHILEAEYSMEHILHGYGTATRALSYRPAESKDVLPDSVSAITKNNWVSNLRFEGGVLKYEVADQTGDLDPNISFKVDGVTADAYNVVKLVIGTDDARYVTAENKDSFVNSTVFFKRSGESYSSSNSRNFYPQGIIDTEEDDRMTIIVYLGDLSGYSETISELRLDLGYEVGQTVEIYSVEMYYVDID